MAKNALAIVLSVSGETEEILRFASQFSLHHCKVLSITSHEHSRSQNWRTLISPGVPQTRIAGVYDITTQIPVIYILESLGVSWRRNLQNKTSCFFDVNHIMPNLLYRDI
jgi:DNA-binding MurR/RpiR family transcriptional regulator